MRHEVWKFELTEPSADLQMPKGAKLLHVDVQRGVPCLWAEVHTNEPLVKRMIRVYGTGHHIDGSPTYVGTFQLEDEGLVFHVYDSGEAR